MAAKVTRLRFVHQRLSLMNMARNWGSVTLVVGFLRLTTIARPSQVVLRVFVARDCKGGRASLEALPKGNAVAIRISSAPSTFIAWLRTSANLQRGGQDAAGREGR